MSGQFILIRSIWYRHCVCWWESRFHSEIWDSSSRSISWKVLNTRSTSWTGVKENNRSGNSMKTQWNLDGRKRKPHRVGCTEAHHHKLCSASKYSTSHPVHRNLFEGDETVHQKLIDAHSVHRTCPVRSFVVDWHVVDVKEFFSWGNNEDEERRDPKRWTPPASHTIPRRRLRTNLPTT